MDKKCKTCIQWSQDTPAKIKKNFKLDEGFGFCLRVFIAQNDEVVEIMTDGLAGTLVTPDNFGCPYWEQ